MDDENKTKEQLIVEIKILRQQVAQFEKAESALKVSEGRYRTIIENIEDGYYEVDLAGNLTLGRR